MTIDEQIKAVEREIGMRMRVYPGWVAKKKMSQEKADHEIAAMREVLKTLHAFQQERDIRATREAMIASLAQALGVPAEPHQTFDERLLEAADA